MDKAKASDNSVGDTEGADCDMNETDEALAARLAEAAGAILLGLRDAGELTGKALGAAGDRDANAMLCRELRAARPDRAEERRVGKAGVRTCKYGWFPDH